MDRRFFETEKYLRPIGSNWKLPSVRAEPLPINPLSVASLARLRGNRAAPVTGALRNASRACAPACTVHTTISERKLYIPTGQRYIKKNGELGAEQKKPFILVTATATIRHGKRKAFFYRVTNRATKVFDSRDGQRKPPDVVRSELLRMCPASQAQAAASTLAEFLRL